MEANAPKKFGLNQIKHIYSFTRDLYKILDNRFTFDSPEDDGERIWRGGEDSTAVASITKTALINATKKYYDEHQCWRKATDDGLGSSHDIQAIIATTKDDGSNEYIDAVCKYTQENQSGYSDFSEEMIRVAKDFYVTPRDCCYAFFMIKNYEKYLLEISKGAPLLKSGDYVHVQGEVTEIKYVESYYGQSPVYTIVGNLGNTFKRYGVVPYDNVSDGDKTKKTTEFYAFVKSSNNGVYYLDRVHKNPKKGYNVIHV